jgi:hypothetical protein
MGRCDKIFAAAWLDADRVMAGTKDNQARHSKFEHDLNLLNNIRKTPFGIAESATHLCLLSGNKE